MDWRFWRWGKRDRDIDEEIAHDLALDIEDRVRAGVPRDEAERVSRRDFGNVLLVREQTREMWGWTSLERFARDVQYGFRTLRNNPMFASMAVLTLALGI